MAWRCSAPTNALLVANLQAAGLITTPRVAAALSAVDRAHYCPSQSLAYEDSPQTIGHGATISAPHMHAAACESLAPYIGGGGSGGSGSGAGEVHVLDIGSGSGYLTHVLAELVLGPERR